VALHSRVKLSQQTSWPLKMKELSIFEMLGTTYPQAQHHILVDLKPNISITSVLSSHLSPLQWHKLGCKKFTFQQVRIFIFVKISKLTVGFFHQ